MTKLSTSTSHLQADHKTYTAAGYSYSSVLSWQGRKLNLQVICTSGLPKKSQPGPSKEFQWPAFHWNAAATQGAPTKHILCILQILPGYGNKDLERKHYVSCDPSEWDNNRNSGLLNAGGTEMAFQVLLWTAHFHLLWFTLGISRRYSRGNFLVDLDFTRFLQEKSFKKLCGTKSECQKKKSQIATITNTYTMGRTTTYMFSICKIQFIVFRLFISINTMYYVWNKHLANKYYLNIHINLLIKCVQCIDSILHSEFYMTFP